MTQAQLNILITMQDKASSALGGLGDKIKSFANNAEENTRSAMAGVGSFLKTGLVAGAIAGVGAFGLLGKSAIDNASQFEQYGATLKVMLGTQEKANQRLQEYSDIASKTPFELPQIVELGNQLTAIGKYSKDNVNMLGDLASAAGKPIDQVSGAFAKLATGQKGVAVDMFRDLLITTEDWSKATGKGVSANGELMATTEEMMAALPKIMKDKNFAGMMAEQSNTLAGKMSNLTDTWNTKLREVGELILPYLKPIIDNLISMIGSIDIGGIIDKFKLLWADLEPILKLLSTYFIEQIQPSFNELVKSLTELWNIVSPIIIPVLKVLATILGGVVLLAFIAITKGIKDALGFLTSVAKAITDVIKWVQGIPDAFNACVKGIEDFGKFIGDTFNKVGNTFNWIKAIVDDVGKNLFSGFLNWIKDDLAYMNALFWGAFKTLSNVIPDTFNGIAGGIASALKSSLNWVIDWANDKIATVNWALGSVGIYVPSIPRFANGVMGFAGGMAVINDGQGKEAISVGDTVYLPQGANVFNARDTKAMTGGQGASITVNLDARGAFLDDRTVAGFARQFSTIIKRELNI